MCIMWFQVSQHAISTLIWNPSSLSNFQIFVNLIFFTIPPRPPSQISSITQDTYLQESGYNDIPSHTNKMDGSACYINQIPEFDPGWGLNPWSLSYKADTLAILPTSAARY